MDFFLKKLQKILSSPDIHTFYTARKTPFIYSFSGNCAASVPISTIHIHVSVSDFYISRICQHISLQQNWSWKYINLTQIYECRNWETKHYNSVLEITVSFLGIHKWELDIYFGFSPALHLQCTWVDCVKIPICKSIYVIYSMCTNSQQYIIWCMHLYDVQVWTNSHGHLHMFEMSYIS